MIEFYNFLQILFIRLSRSHNLDRRFDSLARVESVFFN
jgi:hypothetical protein